jgi:hypothetical protein
MEIVHRDFNITEAQFNAAVEDLQEAVAYLNLPGSPQNRLLARLAPCARRSFIVKIGRFRSWPTYNLMTHSCSRRSVANFSLELNQRNS